MKKWTLLFVHFGDKQLRGSERCIANTIKGLRSSNFHTVLWCNHPELAGICADDAGEVILDDFLPFLGFGYKNHKQGVFLDYWSLLSTARRLILRIKPNLIFCNGLAPCQWMVPWSIFYGIHIIAHLHTTYFTLSRIASLAYGVNALIGVSQYTLEKFLADGFPKHITSVVYNGVEDLSKKLNSDKSRIREEFGILESEFVITSVCALVDWKRVDVLIDAVRILNDQSPHLNMVLLVVGDGDQSSMLRTRAMGCRVVFVGWRMDVADILSISDCLATAAEKEAFGLTLAEAASVSLPVIGANAGGIREVVDDGKTGFLAEPGNPASFATKIAFLAEHKNVKEHIGRQARKSYEERYTVQRMVQNIADIVEIQLNHAPWVTTFAWRRLFLLLRLTCKVVLTKFFQ
jgi:glycosyltransferase involved in cell wall biosynthesis